MSEHDIPKTSAIEDLDPKKMQDATESGELERPQLRRKIDCGDNPDETRRRQAERRGVPHPQTR